VDARTEDEILGLGRFVAGGQSAVSFPRLSNVWAIRTVVLGSALGADVANLAGALLEAPGFLLGWFGPQDVAGNQQLGPLPWLLGLGTQSIAVLYILGVIVFMSTLSGIFQTALYLYASTGKAPAGYDQSLSQGAIKAR
jgi:hypothetical protein